MANHLNRLNNNDARLWDKAFKHFVKTGEWNMSGTKENMVRGPMGTLKDMEAKGIQTHGIMADPGDRSRFPGSRDWDYESLQVPCELVRCVANHGGVCLTPTEIKISAKGCKSYKQRTNKGVS